jgi:uncharacterized repeat protein (TIGR01451 family)
MKRTSTLRSGSIRQATIHRRVPEGTSLNYLSSYNCLSKQFKQSLSKFFNTGTRQIWQTVLVLLGSVGMVVAQNPNLYVHKKINNSQPALNEIVSYTIVVGNDGNATANGVVVKDDLSAGAQYNTHTVLKGANTFTPATGNWNIGSIAAGDSVVLELKAKVVERGVWFNTAEVIESQGTDPNSSPNNHDLTEDDIALVCFSVPLQWYTGDEFTVTIPIPLTNVQWIRNGQTQFTANQAVATGSTLVIKSPGNYSFSGILGSCPVGGCCAIEVIPGPECQLIANASTNPTCEASPLILNATTQGGSAPYIYVWTGPNGFNKTGQSQTIPVATVANAGVYTVKITDVNNCTASSSTTALVGTLPMAICNSPVCEGGSIILSATDGGTSYKWYGPNGFSSSLQSPTIPNATTANSGSYTVVITGAAICSGTAITTLKILPKPIIAAFVSNSACVGGSFSLSATVSNATQTYQYIWTGPDGFYETGQTVMVNNAQLTQSGSYTLTVFSLNGCSNQTVTQPVVIKTCICNPLAAALPPSVCVGDAVSLTSTSGFNSYSWKGPNGYNSNQQNPIINNAQLTHNGSYTLTVAGPNCTGSTTVNVVVQGLPVAQASSQTLCSGNVASIELTSSGGNTYLWKGPNGYSSSLQNPVITNATATNNGSYSVTVSNASGCTAIKTTSVVVGLCQSPGCTLAGTVVSSLTSVCSGGSVVLTASGSGNVGNVSYVWSGPGLSANSGSSVTASNLTSTSTFTVVLTDGSTGCSVSKTVSVVVNPLPGTAVASSQTLCSGNVASIELTSSGGNAYLWKGPNGYSSSLQNPVINNATASNNGSYSVTVSNASGCTAIKTTSVIVGLCPTPGCNLNGTVVSSLTSVCSGGSVVLTASASGNVGNVSYVWSGPGLSANSGSSVTASNLTATTTFTVVLTDGSTGCSVSKTVSVVVNPLPGTAVASSQTLCSGNVASIELTSSGGNAYLWKGPNGYSSSLQNPVINNATASNNGSYSVTVSNASGCTAIKTTSVIVGLCPTPGCNLNGTVVSSLTSVCSGGSVVLTASASGNVGNVSYVWSGPGLSANSGSSVTASNLTATTTFTVVLTDGSMGCSVSKTVSVVVNPLPGNAVASSSTVCSNGVASIELTSSGGNTYLWKGPNGYSSTLQNPVITNATATNNGSYSVTVSNASGCTAVKTTSVIVGLCPTPGCNLNGMVVSSLTSVCSGGSVVLTASASGNVGNVSYVWSGPGLSANSGSSVTASNLTSTSTFTVVLTDGSTGCSVSKTVSVVVNPLPGTAVASSSTVCSNGVASIELTSSGGNTYLWKGPNGYSSSLQNPIINNATASNNGSYSVTVSNASGCTAIKTTSVVVGLCQSPGCTLAGTVVSSLTSVCSGGSVVLTASASGNVGNVSYVWSGPGLSANSGSSVTASNLTSTSTFTVVLTDGSTGCSVSKTVSVVVNPLPGTAVASSQTLCSGNVASIELTSSGGNAYLWKGPNGYSSSLQNPVINNATASNNGSYSVTVSNASGCTAIKTTSVIVGLCPTPGCNLNGTVVSSLTSVCSGGSVVLTASASGNVGNVSYVWSGPGLSANSGSSVTASNLTATTTFTVVLTDGSTGCSVSKTVSVVVNPLPGTAVASSQTLCSGNVASIELTSSGGNTYLWKGPNGYSSTLQNPIITNATASNNGSYSVTVSNASGCTAIKTTSVVVGLCPTPGCNLNGTVVSSLTSVCSGGSVVLTASASGNVGNVSYVWSGPGLSANSGSSVTASNLTSTSTFTVVLTDGSTGCSVSKTVSVVVNPLPGTAVASSSTVCSNGVASIELTSSGGNTYLWKGPNGYSSSLQNPIINNATASNNGSYSVTVSNASGCTAIKTTSVVVGLCQSPGCTLAGTVVSSLTSVCSGGSVVLTASASGNVGNVSYVWSGPGLSANSGSSVTASNLTSTSTFTVVLTDGSTGCSVSKTVSVVVNPLPGTAVASSQTLCSGNVASIELTSSGGNAYLWKGPNGYSSSLQNPVINNATASNNGSYSVTVSNASGCTAIKTTSVIVGLCPTPGCNLNGTVVSSLTSVCSGGSVVLTASASGNVGNVSYVWSGPGLSANSGSSVTASNLTATTTFTVVLTDGSTGCSVSKTVSVVVNPLPGTAVASSQTLCSGNVASIELTSSGGNTYLWKGPNGYSSTLQNPIITNATASNNGSYSVTVSNASGCTAIKTTSVVVGLCPTPGCNLNGTVVSSLTSVCSGGSVVLTASASGNVGNVSYVWSGPGLSANSGSSVTASNLTSTSTFTVVLTDGSTGCSVSKTVSVVVNPLPGTAVASSSTVCSNGVASIELTSSGGNTYLWKGPNGYSSSLQNPIINNATASNNGSYSVTVSNASGCTAIKTTSVVVGLCQSPGCTLAGTVVSSLTSVCSGGSVVLTASASGNVGNVSYVWSGPGLSANSGSSVTASNLTSTSTFTVVLTDGSTGCSVSKTVSVVVNPLPGNAVASSSTLCSNGVASIELTSSGGNTYLWKGPNGYSSTLQNPVITNATATNNGSYSVTVSNASGCTAIKTTSVVVGLCQSPGCNLNGTVVSSLTSVCSGGSVVLTASASGNVGNVSYVWSGPGLSANSGSSVTASNLTATTTFTVVLTDGSMGCSVSKTVSVVVNPLPGNAVASSSTVCSNGVASIELTSSGGNTYLWKGPNGYSSTLQNPVINNATATNNGSYSVTVSNASGCTAVKTTSVIVGLCPTPGCNLNGTVVSSLTSVCSGGSVVLTASASGNVGNVSYVWSGPGLSANSGSSVTASNLTATTTFTVVLTDGSTGCSVSKTVSVVVNPLPGNAVASSSTVCSNGVASIELTSSGGNTYLWKGPNGYSSTLQNPVINNATATNNGSYSVTVSNASGCTAVKTTSVIVGLCPTPGCNLNGTVVSSLTSVCSGGSVVLTASASGNVGSVSYVWSGVGLSANSGSSVTASNLTSTSTFTVVLTDGSTGCSVSKTVSVVVNPLPVVTLVTTSNPTSCTGSNDGSITIGSLTANQSYVISYSRNNGDAVTQTLNAGSNGQIILSPLSAGSYSITATTGLCSAEPLTVTLEAPGIPEKPQISVSPSVTACLGETVTLTATGAAGATFQWTGSGLSALTGSVVTVTPGVAGNQLFTVTQTVNSCTSGESQSVIITGVQCTTCTVEPPVITCTTTEICTGDAIELHASDCEGIIIWSTNETGQSIVISPTVSTTYTAQCKLPNCISVPSKPIVIKVSDPQPPTITAGTVDVCIGGTVSLTATGCEGKVIWSTGVTGSVIFVTPEGPTTYYANCRIHNCISDPSERITIRTGPMPTPGIESATGTVCPGGNSTLTVSNCAGIPMWSTGETTASIVVSPNETTSYTVVCKQGSCVSQTSNLYTVTVVKPQSPQVDISTDIVCLGGSVQLTAMGCSGTVIWSNNVTGASVSVTPTSNMTYSAICKVGNCTSEPSQPLSVTVVNPAAPIIKSDKTLICAGEAVKLTAEGCPSGQIVWSNGSTGNSLTVMPGSTTNYTAQCKEHNCTSGSSNVITINVTNSNAPTPTVTASTTLICQGQSVTLTASGCGNGTVIWSTNATGNTLVVNPTQTTEYYAACKLSEACNGLPAKVTIQVNTPSTPTIRVCKCTDGHICAGDEIRLTVDGCTGVPLWSNGATTTSIVVSPLATTVYTVVCQNSPCSSAPSEGYTVVVSVPTAPVVWASKTEIEPGETVVLSATGCAGGQIIWSTGATGSSIEVSPTTTTSYYAHCKIKSCLSDPTPVIVRIKGECEVPKPQVSVSTTVVCYGGSATLIATGCTSGTVVWSNGDTGSSISINNITGQRPFTAFCKVSDVCKSPSSAPISVSVITLNPPTIATDKKVLCAGETAKLMAVGCPGTVTWSTGETGANIDIQPTATTDYWATCSLGNCISEKSPLSTIKIGAPTSPTVTASSMTVCFGTPVTLTAAGCQDGNVIWSNNQVGSRNHHYTSSFGYLFGSLLHIERLQER